MDSFADLDSMNRPPLPKREPSPPKSQYYENLNRTVPNQPDYGKEKLEEKIKSLQE